MNFDKTGRWVVCYLGLIILFVFGLAIWVNFAEGRAGAPLIEEKSGQVITGMLKPLIVAPGSGASVLLSGASLQGRPITGASNAARAPDAGISVYIVSPEVGMSFWAYNQDDTLEPGGGNTLFIHFEDPVSGGTMDVISDVTCTPGVSKYVLSGTTLQKRLVAWSSEVSKWTVLTAGGPTVEAN